MRPATRTWSARIGVVAAAIVASGLAALPVSAKPPPSPSLSPSPSASPARVLPALRDNSTVLRASAGGFDVAAVGATASGRLGSVVRITIGMKNLGPGGVGHYGAMGYGLGFTYELPPGTQVVRTSTACVLLPQRESEDCGVLFFNMVAGESRLLQMDLKIVNVRQVTTGRVVLTYWEGEAQTPNADTNRANDTAPIVINVLSGDILPVTGTGAASIAVGVR